MKEKRSKSLAEELQEYAFVAPSTEDHLDEELEGAPLLTDDDHQLRDLQSKHLEREASHQRLPLMKGPLELKGEVYSGQGVSREQLFEDSLASNDEQTEEERSEALSEEEEASLEKQPKDLSADEDLYEAYGKLQSDVGLSNLKTRAKRDRDKGAVVQRDKRMWESNLELRVTLQKPLTLSHQLPPEPYKSELDQSNLNDTQSCEEICGGILQALTELEDIQLSKRGQKSTEMQPRDEAESIEAWWKIMEQNYSVLNAFCNASLDRFHRQSMLQSGASTGKGNLQRLHQGISTQVQSLMQQLPNKAIQKSMMPCAEQPRVLGVPSSISSAHSNSEEQAHGVNPEMFTDAEFYETLLNEYLLGHGSIPIPTKKRKKKNHQIESQKKIKLLFTEVQEKLVNFMTPSEADAPAFAKQLFHNLFSQ